MSEELTELEQLLLYLETTSLEPHDDYTSEFTYKDQKILWEYIKELQRKNKILEYIKSGEYLNQVKYERNLLENIVKNMKVSKEDKEFIDMTHRNTELLEENTQLKEEYQTELDENYKLSELWKDSQVENRRLKGVLKETREYINSYDVFKEFSFPLMKRDVENQIKASIKYEFDTSIKKDLLEIIDKGIKENG